jgi:hypothetical protein
MPMCQYVYVYTVYWYSRIGVTKALTPPGPESRATNSSQESFDSPSRSALDPAANNLFVARMN